MAKNSKQTSKKAASAASKVLRNPRSSKASKTAAASALAQTPSRKKNSFVLSRILVDVLLFYLKNTFCISSRLSGIYSAIL